MSRSQPKSALAGRQSAETERAPRLLLRLRRPPRLTR
eukprot:gene22391-31732_t